MSWIVYILQCADGTLYTGVTNNMDERLKKHTEGTGAKFTRGRGPFKMLLSESHPDRSSASKREAQIKSLPKAEKLDLVKKGRKRAV
jgi:putative endonuclease